MRFTAQDRFLFDNKFLQFDIDDEMDAKQKMYCFIESISQPLSEEVLQFNEQYVRKGGSNSKEACSDLGPNEVAGQDPDA